MLAMFDRISGLLISGLSFWVGFLYLGLRRGLERITLARWFESEGWLLLQEIFPVDACEKGMLFQYLVVTATPWETCPQSLLRVFL